MRGAFLAALLATGCAAGIIQRPDGTRVSGVALGAATLECCSAPPENYLAPSTGDKAGSVHGDCTRLSGGNLSATFAGIVTAIVEGTVAYFTGGLAK